MDSKIIFWAEWRAAARVVYMGGASSRMPYFSAALRLVEPTGRREAASQGSMAVSVVQAQRVVRSSMRLRRECLSRSRRACSPLLRGNALRKLGGFIVLACPIFQPRSGVPREHARPGRAGAGRGLTIDEVAARVSYTVETTVLPSCSPQVAGKEFRDLVESLRQAELLGAVSCAGDDLERAFDAGILERLV